MRVTEIDTERGRDKGSGTDTGATGGARHERSRSDEARVTGGKGGEEPERRVRRHACDGRFQNLSRDPLWHRGH